MIDCKHMQQIELSSPRTIPCIEEGVSTERGVQVQKEKEWDNIFSSKNLHTKSIHRRRETKTNEPYRLVTRIENNVIEKPTAKTDLQQHQNIT